MFEISAEETTALGQPLGLRCTLHQEPEPPFRQRGASWTRLAFRKASPLQSRAAAFSKEAVGLDGSQQLVAVARAHSQCEVLHQDLLAMQLPESRFDGIFANACAVTYPAGNCPGFCWNCL
jgi:hypothetical protein